MADPGFTMADPGFTMADPGFTVSDPGPGYDDPGYPFADQDRGYMTAEAVYRVADPTFRALPPVDATPTSAPTSVPPIIDPFVITPEQVFSASAPIYGRNANPSPWRGRTRSRRWVTGVLLLVALAATAAIVAGSHIIAGLRHTTASSNATVQQQKAQAGGPGAAGAQGTGAKTAPGGTKPTAKAGKTPPKPRKHHTAKPPVATSPVRSLHIALAAAFGPDGTADGDNPQGAMFPITAGTPLPWQTDWYATPDFGLLKDGTGLLLDMGKTVTVTSVRIYLSAYRGADLQLRAARAGGLGDLHVVARASDAGGTVRLRLAAPVRARYLLIWFTSLPPNGQGRYQASVYRVVVNGRR
jgi:hypothetical protein